MLHPLNLAVLAAVCAAAFQYYQRTGVDVGVVLTMGSGIVMTLPAGRALRHLGLHRPRRGPAVGLAGSATTATRTRSSARASADEVVGALVLRLEPAAPASRPSARAAPPASRGGPRASVRAWTTRLR